MLMIPCEPHDLRTGTFLQFDSNGVTITALRNRI